MSHLTYYRLSQIKLELYRRPVTPETMVYMRWLESIAKWMKEKEA